MADIKLIAFDLDGTLLNDHKEISERTMKALVEADRQGVILVPATGRLRVAVPEKITSLPFVRYLITLNGGKVWDTRENRIIYQKIFNVEESLRVWEYVGQFACMRDIYADGFGYMGPENPAMIEEYVRQPQMIKMVRETRRVVPDIPEFIRTTEGVEKFSLFFKDMELHAAAKKQIAEELPFVKTTSSLINNIEINPAEANKGMGLKALCSYLNIPIEASAAFGDGDNDSPMIEAAGVGVAMANAFESVRACADYITLSNEEDGVADYIEKYVLKQ